MSKMKSGLDLLVDGGQTLLAGGVRGVDQPAQRRLDLARPVRVGLDLGRVFEIMQQVEHSSCTLVDLGES